MTDDATFVATIKEQKTMADKLVKTEAEWRAALSDLAYRVTREKGTERPFTHDDFPSAPGAFTCVCCGAALFEQGAKFDSGCGWPSFDRAAADAAVELHEDNSLFMRRTEVVCARCDAHLGHVFPDGPTKTGQRFCINGVAIDYEAKD
jgi:peptide-methionine (R)-S-oxide reductase